MEPNTPVARRPSVASLAGGLALLATSFVVAPAVAKEPLRPRGSVASAESGTRASTPRPQAATRSGTPAANASSRGDRGTSVRSERRGRVSSSDVYRRGDSVHRRGYSRSRDYYRHGYRGHRYGYRGHRYGYYGHRYRYPYSWRYGYYRPSWYYPFSVYPWGYWGGPNVVVEVGSRRPYGRYYGAATGALDIDVRPEEAQVFIDGRYVGIADEYDGFPAYLWLEKGTYDVAIYHEGYETIFRQYSIHDGLVIDINDRMQPGEAVHPDDHGPTTTVHRDRRERRNAERAEQAERIERFEAQRVDRSRLDLAIWPEDAAVYLNGHFVGTGVELGDLNEGLVVEPGQHALEVVRPGYGTDQRTVTVAPGQTLEVEVELTQGDL